MDPEILWKNVLSELEIDLGPKTVAMYIRRSELEIINGSTFKILLPNDAIKTTVHNRFFDKITESLKRLS